MAQFPSDTVGYGVWSLNEIRNAVRGGNWPTTTPTVILDPEFANVTLLLHGNGTSGAQNNTFLDSSSNNFTITRNGNTTQGSYSPYGDRWSNYFDGNGDYLDVSGVPISSSGEFCFEAWIWAEDISGDFQFVYSQYVAGSVGRTLIGVTATGVKFTGIGNSNFVFWQGGDNWGGGTLNLNTWHHFVVTRDSSDRARIFVDGQLVNNWSFPNAILQTNAQIGFAAGISNPEFPGYISDLRVVDGSIPSEYQTSSTTNGDQIFTPPTEPLTAVSGTSLLTCQSNRFKDNSSNDFAITVNGDTKVTPFSPYAPSAAYDPATGGGSGYFDGTGDYLSFPTIDIATSQDFCAEAWVYLTAYDNDFTELFCGDDVNSTATGNTQFRISSTGDLLLALSGAGVVSVSNGYPDLNEWVHLAFVRNSNTCSIYVNGTSVGSGTSSNAGNLKYIGEAFTTGIGLRNYNINGYVSDARVVIGSPVYTSNFTPPTAPLTAVTNTSLLCNFTNAGIFDSTGKNVLETVGNAQIDTAVTKFGTGSMEFDGTGDALSVIGLGNIASESNGDFTIEGWVYVNSFATNNTFVTSRVSIPSNLGFTVRIQTNGLIRVFGFTSVNVVDLDFTGSIAVSLSTWTHIAITRESGTWKLWVNGTQDGSDTVSVLAPSKDDLDVGAEVSSNYLNGYIDDLRITKGVARYTANFTPPTKAFPDQ